MNEWKSRIEKVYGPAAQNGRRRNEIMKKIAGLEIHHPRTRKGIIMKIAIPSGIAAVLLLAAGLSTMLLTNNQASAAEQLEKVAQTNAAYKGWVHMEFQGKSKDPSRPLPEGHHHVNTVDGTMAKDMTEHSGRRRITMHIPGRKETVTYDSKSGEIRRADLTANAAKGMLETGRTSPVTIPAMLAHFKKSTGSDPKVVRKKEDGSVRYDITFVKDDQDARKAIGFGTSSITIWVDPKTDLINKMQFTEQGIAIISRITYGKPKIRNIYDLGVPRDAKVIDNRMPADLASVMKRLDARAAKGLGNCLAVITMADVGADGKVDKSRGYVHLYETDTDRWFVGNFRIGDRSGRTAKEKFLPAAPAGWPVPDVKQLVAQLKHIAPIECSLMGKDEGWTASGSRTSRSYEDWRKLEPKERSVRQISMGLGSQIWPNRYAGTLGGTNSRGQLIRDAKRPGLVGVRFEEQLALEPGRNEPQEHVLWLDPARDDMPVETVWRVYSSGKSRVTTEVSKKYLEYAQLPNGQWYPKRWRETRLSAIRGKPKAQPRKSVTECNLLVVPGMKLDKDWFVNPVERFPQKK